VRVTVIATGFGDGPASIAGTASRGSGALDNIVRVRSGSSYDPKDYEIPTFLRKGDRE